MSLKDILDVCYSVSEIWLNDKKYNDLDIYKYDFLRDCQVIAITPIISTKKSTDNRYLGIAAEVKIILKNTSKEI